MKKLLLILLFTGVALLTSHAQEKVEVALYLAQQQVEPGATYAPEPLAHQLYVLYGYPYYKLIKESELDPHGTWSQWFSARADFNLHLYSLPEKDNPLGYEIYQEDKIIAQGKYHPMDGVPLLINGPYVKKGLLILSLWSR